ncbi:MAG: hypothetical protein HY243_08800 [Proteobacteria bacterium]|nr:hypothetical protein [Pseudomonadota bacterium]
MRVMQLALGAALATTLIVLSAKAGPIPMDNPISIDGIDTVCTGIGDEAQHDPRWAAYNTRIEFSNGGQQYLSGAHVVLGDRHGKTLASLDCSGAWVLFKLSPGKYKVTATLTGQAGAGTKSTMITPPAKGQKRFIIAFPLASNL